MQVAAIIFDLLLQLRTTQQSKYCFKPTGSILNHQAYRQTSNISCTFKLVGTMIVDHSEEDGASPVGAAPTSSSFSTNHLASMDWSNTTTRRKKYSSFEIWCVLYQRFDRIYCSAPCYLITGVSLVRLTQRQNRHNLLVGKRRLIYESEGWHR